MNKILDIKSESHEYKVGDYVRIKDTGEEACILDVQYDIPTETYRYKLAVGSEIYYLTEDKFTFLLARKLSSINCGVSAKQEHYQKSAMQPIQVAQRIFTYDQFCGFLMGNYLKYSMRKGLKQGEDSSKDEEKALQYAYWLDLHKQGIMIDPIKHSVPPDYVFRGL